MLVVSSDSITAFAYMEVERLGVARINLETFLTRHGQVRDNDNLFATD